MHEHHEIPRRFVSEQVQGFTLHINYNIGDHFCATKGHDQLILCFDMEKCQLDGHMMAVVVRKVLTSIAVESAKLLNSTLVTHALITTMAMQSPFDFNLPTLTSFLHSGMCLDWQGTLWLSCLAEIRRRCRRCALEKGLATERTIICLLVFKGLSIHIRSKKHGFKTQRRTTGEAFHKIRCGRTVFIHTLCQYTVDSQLLEQ